MHFSKFAVINYNLQKNTLNIFHLINKSVISVAFDFEIKGKSNEYLLEQLNSDQIDSLKNLDIISENKFFDYNKYEIQREMYKYSDKICRFVIHLNYDCNLSCSYCYQNVINKKIIMNDITLNQVNNFIIKVKRKIKPEALDVCFIGGEPTLHSEKILQIMKTINKNCNNIIYSIVTNGTYGNKRILKKLFKLGLNNFMITLDGPQKIHDYLRKDNNNRGSYQTIIRNLKKMQQYFPGVNVSLNCNLNQLNYKYIEELLLDLREKQIYYPIMYSFVIDTKAKKNQNTISNFQTIWKDIHQLSERYGYQFQPFYRDTYLACSLFQKNNYTIGADGYLYACIEAVGIPQYKQSHVNLYGSEYFNIKQAEFIEIDNHFKVCMDCQLLPICDGGCLYQKNNKNFKCPLNDLKNNDIDMALNYYFGEKNVE